MMNLLEFLEIIKVKKRKLKLNKGWKIWMNIKLIV